MSTPRTAGPSDTAGVGRCRSPQETSQCLTDGATAPCHHPQDTRGCIGAARGKEN